MRKYILVFAILFCSYSTHAQTEASGLKQHKALIAAMELAVTWFSDMVSSISTLVEQEKKSQFKSRLEELSYALDDVENEKSRLLMSLRKRNGTVSKAQLNYQKQLLSQAEASSRDVSKLLTVKLQEQGQSVAIQLRKSLTQKGLYLDELRNYSSLTADEKQEIQAEGELLLKSMQAANLALAKLIAKL